jgi:hypothetical protein
MRAMLTLILGFSATIAFVLGAHVGELGSAYARHEHVRHLSKDSSARDSKPKARAAFRYRKGGRCHHYHFYTHVHPDC